MQHPKQSVEHFFVLLYHVIVFAKGIVFQSHIFVLELKSSLPQLMPWNRTGAWTLALAMLTRHH